MKIGDTIVVTSPVSSYYGMRGVVEAVVFRNKLGEITPLGYHCQMIGYQSTTGKPIPFMAHELRLSGFSETASLRG